MAEWKQGYPLDVTYVKYVTNKLSPAHINFCLSLNGCEPLDLSAPFSYIELGAGYGLSLAGWAAQFPNGDFHCVDYNPEHMRWLKGLGKAAGLDNLKTYPESVRGMLDADLPQFDFVALHGFYSWVSDEVRAETRLFLQKCLKPGGCLYVSYNSKPGWSALEPLRHMLVENAKSSGSRTHKGILLDGLHLLKALRDLGAQYFKDVPLAAAKLEAWLNSDVNYLLGELQSQEHRSFFFSDMCADMDSCGLGWAGSLSLDDYLEEQVLPELVIPLLLQAGRTPQLREAVKDLYLDTAFRTDLFAKKCCNPGNEIKIPDNAQFTLVEPQHPFPAEVKHNGHRLELNAAVCQKIQDTLGHGSASFANLLDATGHDAATLQAALLAMLNLEWTHPAIPQPFGIAGRIEKFNRALPDFFGKNNTGDVLNSKLSLSGGWVRK